MRIRISVVCCFVTLLAAVGAGAIEIPSPPPQTAEGRAPYNEALNFPEGDGSTCCEPHQTTGCDDPVCEAFICSIDSWCCEVDWDNICVAEAEQFCAVCGGATPAPVIPTASRTGLIALAGGLLIAGTALLVWRRKRAA